MGAQAKPISSTNSMQRVKVYRLNEQGKWDDQGTGHVAVDYLERYGDQLGLIVIDEEDNDTLLVHRISSDEIYRRQEDTIISWRDPELSTELALSFQEAAGCSYIWDNICSGQRNLHFNSLSNESFHAVNNELRDLPTIELSTLPLILKTVVECGITDQLRVTELILQDQSFFSKLMDMFRMSEDLENIETLHVIFKLVKGIILLNSQQIFEKIFSDEFILETIGCLEYDPEVPQIQHHRAFLKEHVVFKEAIPIKDPLVLSKIHQTYRIGYIKDVILPRSLDEATIASLNSIIHANNAAVISLLKDDASFIQELFGRMKSPSTSAESKRDMVLFLHEFCSLGKSLQMVQQLRLLRDLAGEGIFDIITDVLKSQDRKLVSIGTDILILFLNQDPNLLRSHVIQQEGNLLLSLLVKGMMTDFGEDMHCQFLEIIRILVDSYTMVGSQRDTIIDIFYDKHLDQLIDVIASSCPRKKSHAAGLLSGSGGRNEFRPAAKAEILSNICELLCFCVHHHTHRMKSNFLMSNAIEKVLYLTRRREKFLVVAAVRFIRAIISRNDDILFRHIVKNNLLKPIIEVFVENGNRYNMLHSGVLELLEYIRKENHKSLIIYLVDSFWGQLKGFEHLGTIQALRVKYEQSLENSDTKTTVDVVDPRKRNDERALEKEEEDYFNGDSDEEDSTSARLSDAKNHRQSAVLPNGTNATSSVRPASGGLVDYEDDEDDEDYNPPPRSQRSSADDEDIIADLCRSKHKIASTGDRKDEGLEVAKKRRLDHQSRETRPVESSRNRSVKTSPQVISPLASSCASDSNGDFRKCPEESEGVPERSIKNIPGSADETKQSTGDNKTLTPISSSSPEVNVNSASVSSSEPYSVR